jgi:hypothetical protein
MLQATVIGSFIVVPSGIEASPVPLLDKHNRTIFTTDFDPSFRGLSCIVGLATRDFRPTQMPRNCMQDFRALTIAPVPT